MDKAVLQQYLLRLFEQHDVELDADDDGWLLTDGEYPAIRALWHAGAADQPGRLDVDVVLNEERCIEVSFAGVGTGEAGCRDALLRFEHNAFHLLLAACWYVTDDRQMRIAAWDIGVRTWDVFIGPFSARGAEATSMPSQALVVVETALKREALSPELHWLRLVHRHDETDGPHCEALLDNELWTVGTQALNEVAWPSGDYTARCFMLLDVRDY